MSEKLTIKQHRELGDMLHKMQRDLVAISSLMAKGRERTALRRADKAVLHLRCLLDSRINREYDRRADSCHTYFGDDHARSKFQAIADAEESQAGVALRPTQT